MTHKEIAEQLRNMPSCSASGELVYKERCVELADKIDPPKPEPGTVVWWRLRNTDDDWSIGEVLGKGGVSGLPWGEIEWKPARILAPDEVAVKIPSVSEWPSTWAELRWEPTYNANEISRRTIITRAEAERMEGEK
jgi:hypothetical protein